MIVTGGAPAAQPAGPAVSHAPGGQMGKEQFLQLLVAQIRHQDPLNPLDGTEFASQLAQFATLEQLIQVNDHLAAQAVFDEAMVNAYNSTAALQVIGRSVLAEGSHLVVDEGHPASVTIDLDRAAVEGKLRIFDTAGRQVGELDVGPLSAGRQTISLEELADELPTGTYRYELHLVDDEGVAIAARTYSTLTITGVRYGPRGPVLIADTIEVALGDIVEIRSDR